MEGRKWEDLQEDCLIKVFGKVGEDRVGFETLLADIPFVCKSWHKASLDPQCRKVLNFSILQNRSFVRKYTERFRIKIFTRTKFMELVTQRSTSAVALFLPSGWTPVELLDYVSAKCPLLTYLSVSLTGLAKKRLNLFAEVIGNLRCLQSMQLTLKQFTLPIDVILSKINANCKNFSSLFIQGTITLKMAEAIVTYTPKISVLNLKGASIDRNSLLMIIRGCRELESLDIRDCVGVWIDEEILKEATHIKHFLYMGCSKRMFPPTMEELLLMLHQENFF